MWMGWGSQRGNCPVGQGSMEELMGSNAVPESEHLGMSWINFVNIIESGFIHLAGSRRAG